MRYRQIVDHPEAGTVERLTIVPVLADGRLGAIANDGAAATDESLTLIHGRVGADEHWLTGAALRIPVQVAGFRVQRVHVVAAEGLPDALHLILWVDGDLRPDLGGSMAEDGGGRSSERRGERSGGPRGASAGEHPARLHALSPGELRRRVSADQGIIPGGASPAWIVADVAAAVATDATEG